jgi:hypothetical protein
MGLALINMTIIHFQQPFLTTPTWRGHRFELPVTFLKQSPTVPFVFRFRLSYLALYTSFLPTLRTYEICLCARNASCPPDQSPAKAC